MAETGSSAPIFFFALLAEIAEPALAAALLEHIPAVGLQLFQHLRRPVVDDAGAEEAAAGLQERTDVGAEAMMTSATMLATTIS